LRLLLNGIKKLLLLILKEKQYSEIQFKIDRKCKEIVQLNQQVNQFLSEDLPKYEKQLEELVLSSDVDEKSLNEAQLRFIADLSKQQDHFNQLGSFDKDLSQNPRFQGVRRLIDQWNIKKIVRDNKVDLFNSVKSLLSDFNVDQRFPYSDGTSFVRLIELAVDGQAVEMAECLISSDADLTCAAIMRPLVEKKYKPYC